MTGPGCLFFRRSIRCDQQICWRKSTLNLREGNYYLNKAIRPIENVLVTVSRNCKKWLYTRVSLTVFDKNCKPFSYTSQVVVFQISRYFMLWILPPFLLFFTIELNIKSFNWSQEMNEGNQGWRRDRVLKNLETETRQNKATITGYFIRCCSLFTQGRYISANKTEIQRQNDENKISWEAF